MAILTNYIPHIIYVVTGLILIFVGVKIYKFKKIISLDASYEQHGENGYTQKGRPRNIWDYAFFPGVSRVLFSIKWSNTTVLVIFLLFIMIVFYIITKDDFVKTLLQINFGVLVGSIIANNPTRN